MAGKTLFPDREIETIVLTATRSTLEARKILNPDRPLKPIASTIKLVCSERRCPQNFYAD
ncbi:hypothetical protein [Microcoleus sp. A006_D1]|uniref:hypothetical protein n=1 Tax=Microcoleus sp. A006_D1 TaxID=3055267 RepID=UPI003FA52879